MNYYLLLNDKFWIDGKLSDVKKEATKLKNKGFTDSGEAVLSLEICMFPFNFYRFEEDNEF